MKHSATYIAAILLAIGATGPVNAAIYTPPQIMVEKANVQYITGGIGKDEVAQVRQLGRKHDFNVQLTFAWNTGNFLADIPVTITDARGKPVFTLEKSDPVLMLRLPAGRYTATATYDGTMMKQTFNAPAHGTRNVRFAWQRPQDSLGMTARR